MAKHKAKPVPRGATISTNRRARYDYEILEQHEAGLVLMGSEIKSIRTGNVTIAEGYARFEDGELWLYNVHVAPYAPARESHEPTRPYPHVSAPSREERLPPELERAVPLERRVLRGITRPA